MLIIWTWYLPQIFILNEFVIRGFQWSWRGYDASLFCTGLRWKLCTGKRAWDLHVAKIVGWHTSTSLWNMLLRRPRSETTPQWRWQQNTSSWPQARGPATLMYLESRNTPSPGVHPTHLLPLFSSFPASPPSASPSCFPVCFSTSSWNGWQFQQVLRLTRWKFEFDVCIMYVLFYVFISIFPDMFSVMHFQWRPLLPGLLPWQNLVHRGVLRVPGVRGLPGRHRAGCDGHGPLHPAAWLWPTMRRAHRRLHEETQGQIHPRGRAKEGELTPSKNSCDWKYCWFYNDDFALIL